MKSIRSFETVNDWGLAIIILPTSVSNRPLTKELTPIKAAKSGFTLVELLVVLAIAGILAVATIPAVSSLSTSYNLTSATNNVAGNLANARQQSITLNVPVEVRFYQYAIPGFPKEPGTGSFHAFQLFQNGNATTALSKIQYLPGRIVFSPSSTLSSMFTGTASSGSGIPAGILPSGYTYFSFHFRPDGSTDLSTVTNCLTLVDNVSTGVPPPNYATIVIDPLSGSLKTLRP